MYIELHKRLRLALFCLNGLLSCPDNLHSISGRPEIFEKSWDNSKVRFSNSKNDQNPDFLKLGQRPPGWSLPTFVDWKCVWNPSIWCWEWVLVVFCLFEGTFFWSSFFRKAYAWILEIWDFLGLVKGVWKGPWSLLLIEKVFYMPPFDVWNTLELVFVDLRHLFFEQIFIFYVYI